MTLKLRQWLRRLGLRKSPAGPPSLTRGAAGAADAASPGRPHREGRSRPRDAGDPPGRPADPAGRKGKAQPRVSRHGIPILKPDEDPAAWFREEPAAPERVESPSGSPPGPPPSSGRRAGPKTPKRGRRTNRAGIRRLDDDWDPARHFLDEEPSAPPGHRPGDPRGGVDRHGIPHLDPHADLQRFFHEAAPDADAEALAEALRQSLDRDARDLMKKKGEGEWGVRHLSFREQLRRYPPPQAQLDLHGATAIAARHRAEAFLRTAAAERLFTVRLIVGKGLHSEGGAVLPDVIEDLLTDLKREKRILAYRWEKRLKRKSGSVLVFIPATFP